LEPSYLSPSLPTFIYLFIGGIGFARQVLYCWSQPGSRPDHTFHLFHQTWLSSPTATITKVCHFVATPRNSLYHSMPPKDSTTGAETGIKPLPWSQINLLVICSLSNLKPKLLSLVFKAI
jgi:hypothetical protein